MPLKIVSCDSCFVPRTIAVHIDFFNTIRQSFQIVPQARSNSPRSLFGSRFIPTCTTGGCRKRDHKLNTVYPTASAGRKILCARLRCHSLAVCLIFFGIHKFGFQLMRFFQIVLFSFQLNFQHITSTTSVNLWFSKFDVQ